MLQARLHCQRGKHSAPHPCRSPWDFPFTSFKESSLGVRAVREARFRNFVLRESFSLFRKIGRLGIEIEIAEWGLEKAWELRVAFPINLDAARRSYEVPFGAAEIGKDELDFSQLPPEHGFAALCQPVQRGPSVGIPGGYQLDRCVVAELLQGWMSCSFRHSSKVMRARQSARSYGLLSLADDCAWLPLLSCTVICQM